MIIGIHPDRSGPQSYSDKWAEFLHGRGVDVRLLDLLAPDALEQASLCDGVMWRWIHTPQDKQSARRILYTVEHYLNIPVFPDARTSWHYDEKIDQYYLLRALKAPTPETWVFWNRRQALEWAKETNYPVVFKLSVGASSSNVIKVESEAQAISLINRAFWNGIFPMTIEESPVGAIPPAAPRLRAVLRRLRSAFLYVSRLEQPPLPAKWWKPEYGYCYFQEYLSGNDFDTRVTVIGERAFAFRRMNRPDDFRASGSGRIDYDPELIDRRCIEIAFEVSRKGGFQTMAYDFMFRDGQPVIGEISYTFLDSAVHACPGHWDGELNRVAGQMWPEEAQVEDFLETIQANKSLGLAAHPFFDL